MTAWDLSMELRQFLLLSMAKLADLLGLSLRSDTVVWAVQKFFRSMGTHSIRSNRATMACRAKRAPASVSLERPCKTQYHLIRCAMPVDRVAFVALLSPASQHPAWTVDQA
jgi:hypothetical protein